MKKLLMLALFLSMHGMAGAQVLQPATWHWEASRKEVRTGDTLDLVFTVSLDKGWYLYSNDFDPDLGPMLTEIEFFPHKSYALAGETRAIGPKRKYDALWQGEISYFEGKATFRQTILVKDTDLQVKGRYAYQVCSLADGKCIPASDTFSFTGIRVLPEENAGDTAAPVHKAPRTLPATKRTVNPAEKIQIAPEAGSNSRKTGPEVKQGKTATGTAAGLWEFAALAFLAGLAALITPCVFPMVPMTVTFFAHGTKDKGAILGKALAFGLSIIIIYTIAGTLVAWINGPSFANFLSTHWLPNLFFFAVFLTFALSFLGLFELTLPPGLVNAVDRRADMGGINGMFFMAFTLVLVSFSCTGPIVGALLVASAGGKVLLPVVGMAAFSLAIAIPFTLFAAFPHWLDQLPRSGGWLNRVKVMLGFLELALSLKFLSIADQVYHWGLLDREVYLALWIVIFFLMGCYLLGKIKLPHDDWYVGERVGVPRTLLAIVTFAFVVYLIPGMFGAPLKALAGYLPPVSTHDFNLAGGIRNTPYPSPSAGGENTLCEKPLYGDKLDFPHGLLGYFVLEQALNCAKKQGKPLFIDFTGHGCVNCREMEARVWPEPEVLRRLKNDFVMLALYVDERTELPQSKWYVSSFDDKIKRTVGSQNADYQITRFNNNAQPYYVILDPYTEEPLVSPMAYTLDVSRFVTFLDAGRKAFDKRVSGEDDLVIF